MIPLRRTTGALTLLLCVFTMAASAESSAWKLVWSDEFDGARIDPAKWEFEVNANGGGNNELQYYTDRPENARIENGQLVIEARKEPFTGPAGARDYTSARMRTLKKGDWKFGRFEIRAKLPKTQGLWPAIWMLPTDWVYGPWPHSGEIDIMEFLGHDVRKVYGTLHYVRAETGKHMHATGYLNMSDVDFAEDFHVYSMEWDEREFRWYIDGRHYQTQTTWSTDKAPYPAPFDQRFHLLLNVAVGGNWPGNPDATSVFPQRMVIDYVRIYQRESDAAGAPSAPTAAER